MLQTTRFAACLGLLAGSLTIATAAQADIPVTGGQVRGQAAFFNQTSGTGSPVLFDAAIQNLRIVTPNGTTTTSQFLPSASRFTDTNGNRRADSGDTGKFEGVLSGAAFSRSGLPVFFQNVPTALNFTLTSFSATNIYGGSLISPKEEGAASLIFLPVSNITLSSASSADFEAKTGLLEVGDFSANLTGGLIGLPSDLQFRSTSSSTTPIVVSLGRRIKFDFEGKDAEVVTASETDDVLQFAGETTNFQIQSVGTSSSREFKITGSGDLEIELKGPFDVKKDTLDLNSLTGPANYRIKGEGPGFIAFTGNNSITYSGTSRRDTDFKFEKGSQSFEGKSSGDVKFAVTANSDSPDLSNFTIPLVGITTPVGVFGATSISSSTSSSVNFISVNIFSNTTITNFPGYYNLLLETSRDNDDDDDDDDTVIGSNSNDGDDDNDDDDDSSSYGSNVVYYIYAPRKQVTEVVVERQGDRILVVDRSETRGRKLKKRGQVVGAYQVVGLPSRVFPGLTGLRQIPAEQVESTSNTGTTGTESTSGTGTTTGTDTTNTNTNTTNTDTTNTNTTNTNPGSTTTP